MSKVTIKAFGLTKEVEPKHIMHLLLQEEATNAFNMMRWYLSDSGPRLSGIEGLSMSTDFIRAYGSCPEMKGGILDMLGTMSAVLEKMEKEQRVTD